MLTVEQLNFIASMDNKYDYPLYVSFCKENSMTPVPFTSYAAIVSPYEVPVEAPFIVASVTTASAVHGSEQPSCCGGGQIK